MGAALRRIDIVHEAEYALIEGIIVLEGHLHIHIVLLPLEIKDILIQRRLALVQIGHELLDAALVAEFRVFRLFLLLLHRTQGGLPAGCLLFPVRLGPLQKLIDLADFMASDLLLVCPLVPQDDPQSFGQESHFPEPDFQRLEVKDRGLREDGLVRLEGDRAPRLVRVAGADFLQGITDMAALIARLVHLPVLTDFHLQPFRKGIHHRSAHAVKAAGDLVSTAAELPARM